jgi:hypothetical protein
LVTRFSHSRFFLTAAALLGMAVPVVWVYSLMTPGEEAVKIRNGLAVSVGGVTDFDWRPENTPQSFLANRVPPSAGFSQLASDLAVDEKGARIEGLDVALALSRHLMGSPERHGGAIQAGLDESYNGIVRRGQGYCADFTRVFTGLAIAAKLPVRTWSIAFEMFGAGHSFSEIYDERRAKWILIDSFHSLYFADATTLEPLSVLELHDRLLALDGSPSDTIIRKIVEKRVPFRSDQLALDYYRRGMPQLALVWGNNVFDYDASAPIRWSASISRHLERAVAIAIGQYPTLLIYPIGVSQRDVAGVFRARDRFVLAVGSLLVASGVFGCLLVSLWGQPRDRVGFPPGRIGT